MKLNRTVQRTFQILEYISTRPSGVTLAQISKDLDIPSSSALDIVKTLYHEDCIYYKDEYLKTYTIGSKLYSIGNQYTRNSILLEAAKPLVKEMSYKIHHPIFITKRVGKKLVYVYKNEPDDHILSTPEIGSNERLHTTALGKCLIAFSRSRNLLAGSIDLIKKTDKTITDRDVLNKELDRIIEKKCAFSEGEYHAMLKDIAVPVFNFENRVVGSIGIFYLKGETIEEDSVQELKKIARRISKKLGYRGGRYE